jgi:hypothetical protein
MKKFEDSREEQFACPYCHSGVLPYEGPRPHNVSRRPLLIVHGTRLYSRSEDIGLPQSRAELSRILYLPNNSEDVLLNDWPYAEKLITKWFLDYKKWEQRDTFSRAFAESRMTIRYGKRGVKETLPMKAVPVGRDGVRGPSQDWEGFQLGIGMYHVWQRTIPENFYPHSQKVQQGLYDMSASLLDPQRNISEQTFAKSNVTGAKFVFMPLSDPKDQQVFQRLNTLAKWVGDANPDLHRLARIIRALMTRIKFAYERDIGTNFGAYEPTNQDNPKFKYGPGAILKTAQHPIGRGITQDDVIELRENARHFKRILTGTGATNEIVIAYRQHAGDFPVFAEWNGSHFEVYRFTPEGEYERTDRRITDNGAMA